MVSIPSFSLIVGTGDSITCAGFCSDVPVVLAQQLFTIPCYILPIHGADLVLGVQWLQTLGKFQSDFSVPSIKFNYNNQTITLIGMTSNSLSSTSFSQYCRFLFTDSIKSLHTITMTNLEPPKANQETTFPEPLATTKAVIANLLNKFTSVFSTPRPTPTQSPKPPYSPYFKCPTSQR